MFAPRDRRAPFADPLNWTDYRWDAGSPPLNRAHRRRGPGTPSLGHRLFRFLLAVVAIVVGLRLLSAVQSRNTSWVRRSLFGALLVLVAAAAAGNRRGPRRW